MAFHKLVQEQLTKVIRADLSNFDKTTNKYFIRKRSDIKLEENGFYLIQINDSFKNNETMKNNWNAGSVPPFTYYKVNVIKIMGKMFRINGVAFDFDKNQDINSVWSGWLNSDESKIIKKI